MSGLHDIERRGHPDTASLASPRHDDSFSDPPLKDARGCFCHGHSGLTHGDKPHGGVAGETPHGLPYADPIPLHTEKATDGASWLDGMKRREPYPIEIIAVTAHFD
jgi:hypothetical protein